MQNLREKLEGYELRKYYDIKKLIEQNHPLITQNENFLEEFTEQLNKLSKLNNFDHIIYKTIKEDFWSSVSEIKAMCLLLDKADDLTIIQSNKSLRSPDFKIKKCNVNITIEVKMIQDKFSNKKLMKNETIIKLPNGLMKEVYEIDDISTILNAITASKGQYYKKTPHIIIIDCVSGGIQEDEFEEILYFQKDKPLQGNDLGYDLYDYDGIFFKKNKTGEFEYHMVSGVAAIFGKRVTFFKNPNTSEKIPTNITKLLGFRIYKPYVLEEAKKEKNV